MFILSTVFGLCAFLLVSSNASFVDSTSTHSGENLRKRSVDACGDYFDVRKAHVVHVGKSEALGGRLLNSSTGVSKTVCLERCCQTEHCTVAAYERKGPSNCYLFDCGDVDDFRCELVSYNDYESAILSLPRRQLKIQLSVAPLPAPPIVIPENSCKAYEFQCRTSKECIAGYDRCNGAYECPDHSDEERCDEWRQEQYRLQHEKEEHSQLLEDQLRSQNNGDPDQDNLWDRGRNRAAPDAITARWDFHPVTVKTVLHTQTATSTPTTAKISSTAVPSAGPLATSSMASKTEEVHAEKTDSYPFVSWINFSDPSHFVVSMVLIMALVFCAAVTLVVFFRWLCTRQAKVTKYRIVDPDAEDFLLGGNYG